MLTGLLTTVLAVAVAAAADEGGEPTLPQGPAAPVTVPGGDLVLSERLDGAIDLYLDGHPAEARAALQDLLELGPSLPAGIRHEALAYLGDILLSEQGDNAARNIFETLLAEAPAYRMDPFQHPPEVVRRFEELRRELVPSVPALPLPAGPRDPYPWMVTVPGGAYYFKERQVAPGLTVAALQAAGLGLSVWSRLEMQEIRRTVLDPDHLIRPADDPDGTWERRYTVLYYVNLGSLVAGWSAYLVPVTVETVRWGGAATGRVSVGPTAVRVDVAF